MQRHIEQGNVLQLIMSSLLLLYSNIISNTGMGKKMAACRWSPFSVLAVKPSYWLSYFGWFADFLLFEYDFSRMLPQTWHPWFPIINIKDSSGGYCSYCKQGPPLYWQCSGEKPVNLIAVLFLMLFGYVCRWATPCTERNWPLITWLAMLCCEKQSPLYC